MNQFESNRQFLQLPENARARALLKSMGYTTEELKRPRIGVANSWVKQAPVIFTSDPSARRSRPESGKPGNSI